jgi:hypothetical protein
MLYPVPVRECMAIHAWNSQERGMEVNDIVDERYDLEKSTQGACISVTCQKKNLELDISCRLL